ncbi:MAG: uncharacterized protein KVP18_002214 [Porospora cf. gigantea A]|uniref:uncharacterized protein n=1 Tax=Porospora cf. gigantea A TaxID=2853593 RepID=UPI00355A3996|nr:MAG: hypothetical protein KVP18_002214 [Porospora cf. gigantea A]
MTVGSHTTAAANRTNIGRLEEWRMPTEVLRALVRIKLAAARVNADQGVLDPKCRNAIVKACEELLRSDFNDETFPLKVWQAGSGTNTNMNVNEVLASMASTQELPIHPNDHVNLGQSSNCVFPTAMHLAAIESWGELSKSLTYSMTVLTQKAEDYGDAVKIGRTHMMDAVPMPVSAELLAWKSILQSARENIDRILCTELPKIPLGGTAVGTGLNATEDFGYLARVELATEWPHLHLDHHDPRTNAFHLISHHDGLLRFSGELMTLATGCMKMANDLILLASGPRCGLAEWILPVDAPGSSIMPGKVNPTQCEMLRMVAAQVIGLHTANSVALTHSNLQLNTFNPLIIKNILTSIELLSDGLRSFTEFCLVGMQLNEKVVAKYAQSSLMVATALAPVLGYDRVAELVKEALAQDKDLYQVVLEQQLMTAKEFSEIVDITAIANPH